MTGQQAGGNDAEQTAEGGGGPANRLSAMIDERLSTPYDKSLDDPGGAEPARGPDPAPSAPSGFSLTAPAPADEDQDEDEADQDEEPDEALPPGGGPRRPPHVDVTFRQDRMAEYRRRQQAKIDGTPGEGDFGMAPVAPPHNNWIPIGPSVVLQGQVSNRANVSGRVAGVAIAPGGSTVYCAAANGGVWRSEDGGHSWADTMQAWDLDPSTNSSDSLACGAIAIDPDDPNTVYVGSGEGDSAWSGGGAISGVGPIVSHDGGLNWATEPSNPTLAGESFYSMAVDPDDSTVVVAGTTRGIYRREPDGTGGFTWQRKRSGRCFTVSAASDGTTTRFYATTGNAVLASTDGATWTDAGFPGTNVGRLAAAVQPTNPDTVYVLGARGDNWKVAGVWRLDGATTASPTWRQVSGAPSDLFGTGSVGQGWWDMAIAVDPGEIDRIYLAGSTRSSGASGADQWSSALYRSLVTSSGGGASLSYSMANTAIGANIHADLHKLAITPGDDDHLWVCSDGGLFVTDDATAGADFEDRNVGLNTITCEHLGLHPTEGAVALVGGQDHGTMRYTGEAAWLHMAPGDGGYSVINWADPYKMIVTYPSTIVRRFTDGGSRYNYTHVSLSSSTTGGDPALFYAPMVGTPPNLAAPAEAERVAIATTRPWISDSFGGGWTSIPSNSTSDRLGNNQGFRIKSMVFASATRLYVGTMNGRVFRYDEGSSGWSRTRLDDAPGLPSTFSTPVTDIAVDPADTSDSSIYITFGGALGDARRVWHYDGSSWSSASGSGASGLLDVQFGAVVCDPDSPGDVYAGADIGVWRSTDSGATWQVFSEGLPDAFVMDLKTVKLSNGVRLLRCSTHGRGVFERTIDTVPKQGVDLYIRDTQLDEGRFPTINWLDDPVNQGEQVRHWRGPDIKIDTPDANGDYQFGAPGEVTFAEFVGILSDDSRQVATHATDEIVSRVYVQVHNRGVVPADGVRVTCLLANASAGLPDLPAGYEVDVQNGSGINSADWVTLGVATLDGVATGAPKIAAFALPSSLLPPPASLAGNTHHCVLALVHHDDDPYESTDTSTDRNSKNERKAAHKNLHVVEFTGTVPGAAPAVLPVRFHGSPDRPITLRLDTGGYPGRLRLVLPPLDAARSLSRSIKGFRIGEDDGTYRRWADEQFNGIHRNQRGRRPWRRVWARQRLDHIRRLRQGGRLLDVTGESCELRGFTVAAGEHVEFHLLVDPPPRRRPGQSFPLEILQVDAESGEVVGGLSARVDVTEEPPNRSFELVVRSSEFRRFNKVLVRGQVFDGTGAVVDARRIRMRVDGRGGRSGQMRWHGGWRSFYRFIDQRSGNVTVTARVDGLTEVSTRHRIGS